jgi:hypothetical protein
MTRLAVPLTAAIATLIVAAPALAADYSDPFDSGTDLRSGFSNDWDNSDQGDPLSFELGVRYYYSWGAQSFAINSGRVGDRGTMKDSDQSQSVEAQFRVDDASSKFYAKALGGMSFKTSGSATDANATTAVTDGRVAYAGADLGYALWGDSKSGTSLGPFAGYMYWNDSPNTYHDNFTTATTAADITYDPVTGQTFWPGDSKENNIEMNMLRLGLSGKAKIGSFLDISGEVAAVPYANISGTLGSGAGATLVYGTPPAPAGTLNVAEIQSSPTSLDGWGYGAMGEAMVGIHPTQNLTLRVGGRAWYLQGTADARYSRAVIGNPSDSDPANPPNFDTAPTFSNQTYVTRANPWSVFRYGLLTELTYNF